MELFEPGNGVPSHIEIVHKIVWSWDMYSIDEINRGYARAETFARLKLKLCSAMHTRFSEMTNMDFGDFSPNHKKILNSASNTKNT